jgi:hypothetical protein
MAKKRIVKGKVQFSPTLVGRPTKYVLPKIPSLSVDLNSDPFLDENRYKIWENDTYKELRSMKWPNAFFKSFIFNRSDLLSIYEGVNCDFLCFAHVFINDISDSTTLPKFKPSLLAFGIKNNDPIIDPSNTRFFISSQINDEHLHDSGTFDFESKSIILSLEKKVTCFKAKKFGSAESRNDFLNWIGGFKTEKAIKNYPKEDRKKDEIKVIEVFFPIQDLNQSNILTNSDWDKIGLFPIVLYAENSDTSGITHTDFITY